MNDVLERPPFAERFDPLRRFSGDRVELGLQRRAFRIDRATAQEEARTVELAFSSEEPYERWWGIEILDHATTSVRLGRLNNGGAALVGHDTRDHVGVVVRSWIGDDKKGRALVRFGKSQYAQEIYQDVLDGIRTLVSVGYWIHELKLESTKDDVDSYRVTDWEPLEVSFVSIPADPTVGVGRAATNEPTHPVRILKGRPTMEPEVKDKAPAPAAPTAADLHAATNTARDSEVARIREITAIGKQFDQAELAAKMVDEGRSAEEMRKEVLARIQKKAETDKGKASEIGLNEREVQRFSFVRLMNALANPQDKRAQEAAGYEREVSTAAAAKAGKAPSGFFVPVDILRSPGLGMGRDALFESFMRNLVQRDLTVGTSTAGGHTVGTDLLASSFIDLLRKRMALQSVGATVLRDLVGNIAIPRQTAGATAYWVAESGAPTEGQQAVDQVTMSPKTVGAYTDYSRKLLIQSSIDVEAFVRNDLTKVIGLALDLSGLYGLGSGNQPTGVKNQSGINTVDFAAAAPTFVEVVQLETEVASDNADIGSLAYLINAVGRGGLKTTEKASSTGQFIWEQGNTVNGYPTVVSNQVASGDFWFGNWADLVIGMWSGLDIMVDPYTGSTSGTVRIVALQDVDIAVRHPESFCRGNNTL
ncbi:MAG: phage major capsid protein [Sinimarinibacterium sp.]|jgi:HK97 family phage major capsid protein